MTATLNCTETVVHVTGLEVPAFVGLHIEERQVPQTVVIDIECVLRRPVVQNDDLSESVDYMPIVNAVRTLASYCQRKLIESLAEEIAVVCFKNKHVHECRIRIRKPRKFPDCAFVGVTRTFKRSSIRKGRTHV